MYALTAAPSLEIIVTEFRPVVTMESEDDLIREAGMVVLHLCDQGLASFCGLAFASKERGIQQCRLTTWRILGFLFPGFRSNPFGGSAVFILRLAARVPEDPTKVRTYCHCEEKGARSASDLLAGSTRGFKRAC